MSLDLESESSRLIKFLINQGFSQESLLLFNKVPILHYQWEMDSDLWIVSLENDLTLVVGTNHGRFYFVQREEIQAKLSEYQDLCKLYEELLFRELFTPNSTKV